MKVLFPSGAVGGLEIYGIITDSRVEADFPVRGATHVFSNAVKLQSATVNLTNQNEEVELNETTEITEIEIKLTGSDVDEEDSYLRSFTVEQKGSADNKEIGDLTVLVEGDEEGPVVSVNGDQYTVSFPGRGYKIDERDSIKINFEINTDEGSNETIRFEFDDESDIYIVGASYGYGLPVTFTGNGSGNSAVATIQSGNATGKRVKGFEEEVSYGDSRVLGAEKVNFEGEDVKIEDLTFSVTLSKSAIFNSFTEGDIDEITINNLRLDVDGENALYANDTVTFKKPADATFNGITVDEIEFKGNYTIDVRGDGDVEFQLIGDIDDDWVDFDGATLEFTLIGVDEAEGVVSEKNYKTDAANYFFTRADTNPNDANDDSRPQQNYESVEIVGSNVSFTISDDGADEDMFVGGSEGVVFATVEIDATDSSEDVEIDDIYLTFQATDSVAPTTVTADLGHIDNCRIVNERGSDVGTARGSLSGRPAADAGNTSDQIKFKVGEEVDAGNEEKWNVVCDIDDDAAAGDIYKVDVSGTGNTADRVEYTIKGDDREIALDTTEEGEDIVISAAGTLSISVDPFDSDNDEYLVAVGSTGVDNVKLATVELNAESEDIKITDVYLADVTIPGIQGTTTAVTSANIKALLDSIDISLGNKKANSRDFDGTAETIGGTSYDNNIRFEDVNEIIRANKKVEFTISADYNGISDSDEDAIIAGASLAVGSIVVEWEGQDSDNPGTSARTVGTEFSTVIVHPSIAQVTVPNQPSSFRGGLGNADDVKLYEFTVSADGGNEGIWLGKVGLDLQISGTGIDVNNLEIRKGRRTVVGFVADPTHDTVSNLVIGTLNAGVITSRPEEINSGSSTTFSVYGDITGTTDDSSVTVKLASPKARINDGDDFVGITDTLGSFVWSSNARETDEEATALTNEDWFNGYAIYQSADITGWTLDRR